MSEMLKEGRMTLNADEHAAVDKLVDGNAGEEVSITRRDPGESGPLLVHVANVTYEIATDGKRKKVT